MTLSPAAHFLIADDDRDVLEALKLLLRSEGYAVDTAMSPAGILAAVGRHDFDAALIDMNYARDTTSGSEGFDLIQRLQHLDATLPLVVMTAWGSIEGAVTALYKNTPGIYGALFDTAVATAKDTVATLKTATQKYTPQADYSDRAKLVYSSKNQLASALQLAAELIVTGTGVKLLHVTLGGFDTHYTELNRHDDLMGYFDQAVSAFYQDLTAHGVADKVLVATWSEFGRRPRENASGGTDHGAAAPVLLIGNVKGGFYGDAPKLENLDSTGNLKYSVDFRSVYQEILTAHLGADSKSVLGGSFEPMRFIKTPAGVAG